MKPSMSPGNVFALSGLLIACACLPTSARAQQVSDTSFTPVISAPAYREGTGPLVLIDEGHHNFHTMSGRFRPFARLLERDGYVVKPHPGRFDRTGLAQARILVISNALAEENVRNWTLPTWSAFDSAEIVAIRNWVDSGGSLWLIADHMPFAGSASRLAASMGILMGDGFAIDSVTHNGRIHFSRSTGTLAANEITRGRNASERVDSVISFAGQAFRLEGEGKPLMTFGQNVMLLLPEVAWQFSPKTPFVSASKMFQGAALRFGKGKIAVFGEAAMFSAQLAGPNRFPVGMNDPSAPQNAQFVLNVAHWLSGIL